jgi:type I restriction-modification system DNA methylase subunit
MTAPDQAYTEIQKLVQRFKNLSATERKGMNENATRQGYILPLFRALGWDTDNINEVSPEEKVSRGWVDFSFRLGGIPRFYLETKKVSEDLNDPRWVKQSIDYAWTKSVTWALLSDFEGLRVFNAEIRADNPFQTEFLHFDLDSYLTDFERLCWLSRAETAAGRLNAEAEKWGKKMKRQPVSQHLFDDLKQWRMTLYKDLTGYNMLSGADADNAVLRILNRLIFIRTAEDRQVEAPILRSLVRALKDQKRFQDLSRELSLKFRELDAVYNSELFAPHFSEGLYISPTVLEEVINGLYEKNYIIYNFNAIESDVLGTAYEQYLGAVVAKTPEPEAPAQGQLFAAETMSVQERRQKRKSQGIYYTPTFVTKYIVKETVGKWLDEHGYNPSRPPRVLDMACGSGSFLIGAFDALDAFVAEQRGDLHGEIASIFDRARQLEVLTNCIYGVDKDKQAVEVARLNLLLRALHGREKLPLLTNIYHGDSLHPETWQQGFDDVIKAGGFDLIIGNPPYIRAENMPRDERDYYMSGAFETVYGRFDIYILFLEQAIKMLKKGGQLGFIIPYSALNQSYGKLLRRFILKNCLIETIVDLSQYKVFETAEVASCILILHKRKDEQPKLVNQIRVIRRTDYSDGVKDDAFSLLDQNLFENTVENMFRLELAGDSNNIAEKINGISLPMGQICYAITGVVAHDSKTGASKDRLIHATKMGRNPQPYIEAKETEGRYCTFSGKRYIEYVPKEMHRPKFPELFENPKILIPDIIGSGGLNATLDLTGTYTNHSFNCCVLKKDLVNVSRNLGITNDDVKLSTEYSLHFILGIINSKLVTHYFKTNLGGGLHASPSNVRRLPIRRIDFANPAEKAAHDEIVALVEEMLGLQKERAAAESALDDRRFTLQKRIEQVDAEIDRRVYTLYELTEEEIKVVEGAKP